MNRKFISLSLLIFLCISLLTINVSSELADTNKMPFDTNIMSVDKRVNVTETTTDEFIIIEIILKNLGTESLYNILVEEPMLTNPFVTYLNLAKAINFSEIQGGNTIMIAYTFSSSKVGTFRLAETLVTYEKVKSISEENIDRFRSFSRIVEITVESPQADSLDFEREVLILFIILVALYSVIMILRTAIQTQKRSNDP